MHNHKDKHDTSMVWMMLACMLPLLAVAFLSGGGAFSGKYSWALVGGVAAIAVTHLWGAFRRRQHPTEHGAEQNEEKSEDKNPSAAHTGRDGCCH